MYKIYPLKKIKKTLKVASDKSISHRAAIFSSLSPEVTKINSFLKSDDTLATLDCLRKIGIDFYFKKDALFVKGKGFYFPEKKKIVLFANESGTTIRILTGLLVAQKSSFSFRAAKYLSERPMGRIVYPLRAMGAHITGKVQKNTDSRKEIYPPLEIKPALGRLTGRKHCLKISSAQVKSALLLAGLYAKPKTVIQEPYKSRDHTERMLKAFGADIKVVKNTVTLEPSLSLKSPGNIFIPSDFSSVAFFLVLGVILKNSRITLKKVSINPTRCGLMDALKKMGAEIKITNRKGKIEPYADITVESSRLKGITLEPAKIPAMIDEIPVFCVAAAFAKGKTEICGVKELTFKETNRVKSMVANLQKAGASIECKPYQRKDLKITITGKKEYKGADFISYGDHRTAMSMIVFALAANSPSSIDNVKCIDKSFPDFIGLIESLR